MNRRALLALPVLAFLAAACGGGGNVVVGNPPPPTGNFSNASLNGQYAFSMTGREVCDPLLPPDFFGRIGSFTADGNGRITGGVEDVNTCIREETLQFTSGSYSIQADGRGTLTLTNSTGTTNYSITLSTTSDGFIIQTDVNSTAGGSFQKQNPAAFSNAQISGGYVFDFSGVSANVLPESIVGRFTADGGGGISRGQFDKNEDGAPTGPFSFTGTSYQLDPVFATDGRGTASVAGQNLAFYIVDATRLKFISSNADFPAALVGEAFAQQPNLSFNLASVKDSFAFLIGGASTTGPIASAGRFTADGAGNLSAIVLDENNNGGLSSVPTVPTGSVTGSYTVDANGLGGGTMTWTDSTAGTFEFVFYLISTSPARAVFQETDTGITSDGSIFAQTSGPISNASLAGDYAFIWNGVSSDEEDFVGHLALTSSSSNNASGTMDFNEFGPAKQFFNIPISGALTIGSNPAARNSYQVTANAPPNPAVTFNFSAYVVDANTVLLVGTDKNRVVAGNITRQP